MFDNSEQKEQSKKTTRSSVRKRKAEDEIVKDGPSKTARKSGRGKTKSLNDHSTNVSDVA